MIRWPIIRTLLYKEVLRYRYNWGLLVMVGALLALAGLVSVSSRFKNLPGLAETPVTQCYLFHDGGTPSREWINYLTSHPPGQDQAITPEVRPLPFPLRLRPGEMAIQLTAPPDRDSGVWRARYWYAEGSTTGVLPYRDWFVHQTREFLGTRPRLDEESLPEPVSVQEGTTERIPLIITALTIFALYLLSFNLYITSTGEEREKRVLLALLLSPASPVEVIAAKAIFYATSSLAVALAVVSMYRPVLLLSPLLWCTVVAGSVGYVAIGTVVITIVRRQTTINTVSMLYLIATSIIMFLSQLLVPFAALKYLLLEDYLYRQMKWIIGGQSHLGLLLVNQVLLLGIAAAWTVIAVWVFSRHGMAISRGR